MTDELRSPSRSERFSDSELDEILKDMRSAYEAIASVAMMIPSAHPVVAPRQKLPDTIRMVFDQAKAPPSEIEHKPEAPHRAVRLKLNIEADSREYLERAVDEFSRTIEQRVPPGGACGGYDWGWSYEMSVSEGPTHDEYAAALEEYLGRKK